MREVTRDQVIEILNRLDIQEGDGLLVHSAIQFLGRPIGGVGMYLQALKDVLGPTGTLAVPAFNFAFARGERFHPQETPSVGMGVFSEFVRQQPGAMRTTHPLQSLALIGQQAGEIARLDTPGAFDPGSAFERLLQLDFKLLLLGADVQAVSMIHYSEQRAHVPYRYWKSFSGEIYTPQGWQTRTYRMFVRDLDLDAQLELYALQALLQQRGQWTEQPLNYGKISLCRLVDFVAATDEMLSADPWSLANNRPEATRSNQEYL